MSEDSWRTCGTAGSSLHNTGKHTGIVGSAGASPSRGRMLPFAGQSALQPMELSDRLEIPNATSSPQVRTDSAAPTAFSPAKWGRRAALCVLLGAVLSGCSSWQDVQFRLNTEGRSPESISRVQAKEIHDALDRFFGTPDEARVPQGVPLDPARLALAAGPVRSDEQGAVRGLYRQHCAACHGISGDGAGPAAAVLDPYPRDFRNGVFKYTSTAGGSKPVRADIERILRRGIPGTAMPAFSTLPEEHFQALVEYVVYLSLRGETELALLQKVVDEDQYPLDPADVEEDIIGALAGLWQTADQLAVDPPHEPAREPAEAWQTSVARGRELFLSKATRCDSCHGAAGRGDGEQAELYDDWNRRKVGATPEDSRRLAARFRLPLQRLRARDFTQGVFHGGDRPLDIYWRIGVGLKGTPMPAWGPGPGTPGVLGEEDIWHVVHFVESVAGRGPRPSRE